MPERQSSPGETTEEGATATATGSEGAPTPTPPPAPPSPPEGAAGSAGAETPVCCSPDDAAEPASDSRSADPAAAAAEMSPDDAAVAEEPDDGSGIAAADPTDSSGASARPAADADGEATALVTVPAAAGQNPNASSSRGAGTQSSRATDPGPTGNSGAAPTEATTSAAAAPDAGEPTTAAAHAAEQPATAASETPRRPAAEQAPPAADHEPAAAGSSTVAAPVNGLSGWFTPRRPWQPLSQPSPSEETRVISVTRGSASPGRQAGPPTQQRSDLSTPAAAPAGRAQPSEPHRAPAATAPAEQAGEQATVRRRADSFTRFDPPTLRLPAQSRSAVASTAAAEETPSAQAGDVPGEQAPPDRKAARKRKRLLLIGGALGLLALLYFGDLVLSTGNVARGVTVAGLELGGLSKADARRRLQEVIEPRARTPITLTAGSVQTRLDPKAAGLEVDYTATLNKAGEQPLNPFTRIVSFFTTREIGVVNSSDPRVVGTALEQLGPVVDTPPREGTVKFEGATPVPVLPAAGQRLDVPAAVALVQREWAGGSPIALPMVAEPTITTPEDVQQALTAVALPAVSGPLTVQGEGAVATVAPAEIAAALTFRADALASPKLVPEINVEVLKATLSPQLQATERPGRDATLDFSTGAPVITPSQNGRGVDYQKSFQQVIPILTGTGERKVVAVYADQPAKITTEDIGKLGITGEISSFTTGGFAADSGLNIKRAAERINGIIVKPGETFSLNAATNPRNAANGYIEAGIIEDGHPARGIGGGVSQVATTLYNAAYFAGMVDVAHKEHSFYISRYPAGREATVFDDIIDLKFRNDGPTAVLIQTRWTPSSLTIKLFGTKRYEVSSETGPRTNFTEPQTVTIPAGRPCQASKGGQGFTVTDTRVMRNLATGEVTRKARTVRYDPSPTIVCGG